MAVLAGSYYHVCIDRMVGALITRRFIFFAYIATSMNLSDFKDGTPSTKPWLDIVANSISAKTASVNGHPTSVGLVGVSTPPGPVLGTAAEFSLLGGVPEGSFTINPSVPIGSMIYFENDWLISLGAATSFTLRLKVNNTTVHTVVIPAGAVVNQVVKFYCKIGVRGTAGRIFVSSNLTRSGSASALATDLSDGVWLSTGANTIGLTGQFADTNGTWRQDICSMNMIQA